uniref:[histone H3]-dimethyl-L-lysine(36) demethylase n=1 Tax=Lepeophtheirus salmonis TaxID=72036 RepID=A0A0K2TRG6_LEPSM
MSSKKRSSARQRRQYIDGMDSDSDSEPIQFFNVQEKLANLPRYYPYFVKELEGDQVNLEHFQRNGFNTPILIKEKTGLGMKAPDSSFSVTDVKNLVGSKRLLDVMDCTTQTNTEMSMKEWEEYYKGSSRDRILNVISLEFSKTRLENYVIPPKVVRDIDWTENIWPRHLKEEQKDGTNDLNHMKYPKVQKYCLMSIEGSYTDFHIDFGGTSVWYHIVKGKKTFWLIPPTEINLKTYEQWTLSGKQGDIFFGDLVEKCGMVTLTTGNTFFIPSAWIHAVHTPEDSLVFGGNFLHSFSIDKQIRVAQIEEVTKVPQKFRFPFFTELQWYTLDKYAYALLGRTHLNWDERARDELFGTEEEHKKYLKSRLETHPHITPQELFGLKTIIMFIHALAVNKKNVPALLNDPISLIKDIKLIVEQHKNDDLEKAVTGKSLLHWPKSSPHYSPKKYSKTKANKKNLNSTTSATKFNTKTERVPCKICQACISPDCLKCINCVEKKFKRICFLRQCLQPLLPSCSTCQICGLDGWFAETDMRHIDRPPGNSALMECCLCNELTHATCMTDYGVQGFVRMDLPNSWECPKCIKLGIKKEEQEMNDEPPTKSPKAENSNVLRKPVSVGCDANFTGYQLFSVKGKSDQSKGTMRLQLAEQILSASTHPAKKPSYVFRPPPKEVSSPETIYELRKAYKDVDLLAESSIILPIFQQLTLIDLSVCSQVCRAWHKIAQDPSLWNKVAITRKKINSRILSLITSRQPVRLNLDWCTSNKQQLAWLIPRIPQTRSLSLVGMDYPSCVAALNTVSAPMIQDLNLSYVTNFSDSSLYKLLSSPNDSRPGLLDKKSRLKFLRKLYLKGTEISDVSLRYIGQFLAHLTHLDISSCWKISDAGLIQLSAPETKTADTLTNLNLESCKGIGDNGLITLVKCKNLSRIDLGSTSVSPEGMRKYIEAKEGMKLKMYGNIIDSTSKK